MKNDIASKQPEISVGIVGHVDHGKTTLVSRLSGKWTDQHSEELKRGITIRLGYADAIFYQCKKCKSFGVSEKCTCGEKAIPTRKVSFVDAPGHETLMATMLSGAAIIDGALLLVAVNETCPQPQTKEHIQALEIIGVNKIIIVQNKIDLVTEEQAEKNYKEIKEFVKGTIAEHAPIIPISAQHNVNIDKLVEAIEQIIETPKRDTKKEPLMYVARSFDINRPGIKIQELVGGVLGGALKQGVIKKGEIIEIRPGKKEEKEGKTMWQPITTSIASLKSGGLTLDELTPGGSLGLQTKLDPALVKADQLAGHVVGLKGKLPAVWYEFWMQQHLLKRIVGAKDDLVVEPIKKAEPLMLNVNSAATVGVVTEMKKDKIYVKLKLPVCCNKTDRITISRRIGTRWRLIGYGEITE